MVIRSDKIGQSWLLPLDVSELIPEDHICNLVEVVVDSMDVGVKAINWDTLLREMRIGDN